MTRHEIEKRCREEMQQTIPNKDALWARIEERLPEQPQVQIYKSKPNRRILYRTMTAAACFLFIIACVKLWSLQDTLHSEKNQTDYMMSTASDESSDCDMMQDMDADDTNISAGEATKYPATSKEEILHYSEIAVPQNHNIADQVQTDLLGTDDICTDIYFNESDVLAQTEAFVHVIVRNGVQSEDGSITYEMNVLESYGTDIEEKLFICTDSLYIMEQWHEYWLPLSLNSVGDWVLAYECAPQIESTQDGQVLFQNGWISLIQEQNIPVLCDICSENDYFYDRMYLTDIQILRTLIIQWETEKYT